MILEKRSFSLKNISLRKLFRFKLLGLFEKLLALFGPFWIYSSYSAIFFVEKKVGLEKLEVFIWLCFALLCSNYLLNESRHISYWSTPYSSTTSRLVYLYHSVLLRSAHCTAHFVCSFAVAHYLGVHMICIASSMHSSLCSSCMYSYVCPRTCTRHYVPCPCPCPSRTRTSCSTYSLIVSLRSHELICVLFQDWCMCVSWMDLKVHHVCVM
jgi:hypothetical protein